MGRPEASGLLSVLADGTACGTVGPRAQALLLCSPDLVAAPRPRSAPHRRSVSPREDSAGTGAPGPSHMGLRGSRGAANKSTCFLSGDRATGDTAQTPFSQVVFQVMTLALLRFVEGAHVGYCVPSASNTSGPGDSTRGGCGCTRASPRTYSAPTCTGITCTDTWTHHVYYDHARADAHTRMHTWHSPKERPCLWAGESSACGLAVVHCSRQATCAWTQPRGDLLRPLWGAQMVPVEPGWPLLPASWCLRANRASPVCLSAVFIIYASLAFSIRL